MMLHPGERVVLSIDGANLHATTRALGADIDFRRLLADFQSKANVLRAYYYTAVLEGDEASTIRPLIDWLDYNGFSVVTKPAREYTDSEGRRKVKGNMDLEIAVDAMELARHYDHFVLFSGDGDFTTLVAALQRAGKRVTVASSLETPKPMVSDDLRRQADYFLEISSLATRQQPAGTNVPIQASRRSTKVSG